VHRAHINFDYLNSATDNAFVFNLLWKSPGPRRGLARNSYDDSPIMLTNRSSGHEGTIAPLPAVKWRDRTSPHRVRDKARRSRSFQKSLLTLLYWLGGFAAVFAGMGKAPLI
jgi:hypothetical protein